MRKKITITNTKDGDRVIKELRIDGELHSTHGTTIEFHDAMMRIVRAGAKDEFCFVPNFTLTRLA